MNSRLLTSRAHGICAYWLSGPERHMEGRGTQEGRANSPFTATMSEPAGPPEGLRDTPERSPADPPSAGAPSSGDTGVFDPAAALFGEAPPEPTDDTPTVISKQTPRAVSSEE